MAISDNIVFTKDWYNEILQGDGFSEASPQELAYCVYAAMIYSFTNEKTNIGEVFGGEYNGLNRVMNSYYGQIDRIILGKNVKGNQKYDSDKIEELAAQGMSQVDICLALGYDPQKSRSLSSNPGYKRGRTEFLQGKNDDSTEEAESVMTETDKKTVITFDF